MHALNTGHVERAVSCEIMRRMSLSGGRGPKSSIHAETCDLADRVHRQGRVEGESKEG